MAKLPPHLHGADAGLKNIKLDGIDHWLDVQKKRWSCPDCGTSFSWYAAACSKCGSSLASKAHKSPFGENSCAASCSLWRSEKEGRKTKLFDHRMHTAALMRAGDAFVRMLIIISIKKEN